MKVRELQEELSKLNPESEIICYSEDERFADDKRGFLLLDISAVGEIQAEKIRLDDGTPYLKFSNEHPAVEIGVLNVTVDF